MEEAMPKISIIVPIYKTEKYLRKCVESIIEQTLKDIEIILVDDGSPDLCGAICDEYAQKDNRIKVIHKINGGLSDARNVGIANAKGEFLGFVDSDDYIVSDMYEILYDACIKHNAEIAGCNLQYVYEDKEMEITYCESKEMLLTPEDFYREMMDTQGLLRVGVWNKIYKRELFDGVKFPKGKHFEDIGTLFKPIFKAKQTVYITKPCYMYLKGREDSITGAKYGLKDLDRLEMGDILVKYIQNNQPQLLSEVVVFKLINCNLTIANLMIRTNNINYSIVKTMQKEVKRNICNVCKAKIRIKKKIQLFIFALCFDVYKVLVR